jgi:aspartyl-tRNA(Asn)/glutamyl-tRNA(Gln) amidotransferase subunit A
MALSTFAEDRRRLLAGNTSVGALVETALETVAARNGTVNAFVHLDAERARALAAEADRRRAQGETRPLDGLVVGLKDNLCVRDQPTTCGSRMLSGYRSLFTATAVQRLLDAGAVPLGALNCDEFAMGSSNETSVYGPVLNPLDETRVAGGSSGGSAAAVAAGMVHVALGSDTGGSIRLPAAFTGVVGLKPTYGRVSRSGLLAFASSFDQIGPLARSVADAALVYQTIAGHDPADATSSRAPVDTSAPAPDGVAGLRVGLPVEFFGEGLDASSRRSLDAEVERLRAAGAEICEVSLPSTPAGIATYYVLTTAEASSNLGRFDGVRFGHRADLDALRAAHAAEREALAGDPEALAAQPALLERFYTENRTEGFGAEVKRRIMLGTYVLSAGYYDAYFDKAQRVRALVRQEVERVFETVDVLLTPVSPDIAFRLGEKSADPLQMYLADVYTVTANLAGIPALVVPARTPHPGGLPVGVQLMAPAFAEQTLFRVGAALASDDPTPDTHPTPLHVHSH